MFIVETSDGGLTAEWQPLKHYENRTVELIGPKINKSYAFPHPTQHYLIPHGSILFNEPVPLDYHQLKQWYAAGNIRSCPFD